RPRPSPCSSGRRTNPRMTSRPGSPPARTGPASTPKPSGAPTTRPRRRRRRNRPDRVLRAGSPEPVAPPFGVLGSARQVGERDGDRERRVGRVAVVGHSLQVVVGERPRGAPHVNAHRGGPIGTSLRGYRASPIGQLTPVPPRPQYPAGFFARYCWW